MKHPEYTEFHPRWHRPRVSTYWWLGSWYFTKFIAREVTSVFVAWTVVLTLLQLNALGRGPIAYAAFVDWLRSPLVLTLNLVTLAFVVYHSVTWFNLAPRAMVVKLGGKRLPDLLIAGSNYAGWIGASALLAWLVLG